MAQKRNTPLKTFLVTLIIVIVLLGMVGVGILSSFSRPQAPAQSQPDQPEGQTYNLNVDADGQIQVTPQ